MAFLLNAQDAALPGPEKNKEAIAAGENASIAAIMACDISNITIANISGCTNGGTNNIPEDDFFTADVTVTFSGKPDDGKLILTGRGTAEVHVLSIGTTTHTFNAVQMRAAAEPSQPIYLMAYFSEDPTCDRIKSNAGTAPVYCSTEAPQLCPIDGGHNQTYPACWPPEGLNLPSCENSLSYAPDPEHPELTPLKYIRVVVHVFQKEDKDNPGHVDPNDPGNFTEEDKDLIQSFFDGPGGINDFWANLCPATDDYSPDILDARIRMLNTGTVGYDLFFHPDNYGWGTSYYETADCDPEISPLNCCYGDLTQPEITERYITGPGWSPTLLESEKFALSSDDIRNAYHIFLAGGRWKDCNQDNHPDTDGPESPDKYNYGHGGFTYPSTTNCINNTIPPTTPLAITYGIYKLYSPSNPSQIMRYIRIFAGELYHVMGVDHIGPLRAHKRHVNGDDGCEDTPWGANTGAGSSSNVLSCDFSGAELSKCALTQCQLGKIHYFFERLNPAVQRFPSGAGPHEPVGAGTYNMVGNCDINVPDIIIGNGESQVWDFDRQLRSNVIVEPGGILTIKCRVGMPNEGKMTVKKGGRLTVDGGEVYNNCAEGWKGFEVDGDPNLPWSNQNQGNLKLLDGALIQGAVLSEIRGGGRIYSNQESTFLNCGGIILHPYTQSKNWFFNTNFIYDGSSATIPIGQFSHVTLSANRGTLFSNCDFTASNVPQSMLEQTIGISATGSSFSVIDASTFNGFNNGIFAQHWFSSPLSNFSVGGNCTFSNNKVGINAFGTNNISIIGNVFDVGGGAYKTDAKSRGIVLTNCTGYTIEKNSLQGTDNIPDERIGILIENSGSAANRIKDNILNYLSRGNQAQLANTGIDAGLQYLCNQNSNNPRDFLAVGSIFPHQGNGKAARNTFTKMFPPDGDFRNEVNIINYYHSTVGAENPDYVFGIDKILVQKNNSCFGDPGNEGGSLDQLTPTEWQETEIRFYDARTIWQNETASLEALLDGGNTSALLSQVNAATQFSGPQVVQQLQANSPYLTTPVLLAAIAKIQVLSSNSVRDVLIANPDELGITEIRAAISANFALTTASDILSHTGDSTARTGIVINIGDARSEMFLAADKLIRHIAQDTITYDLALLRTWLGNKQNLEADYSIVSSYISEGDFAAAYQKLSDIEQAYTLDAQQVQSHSNYVALVGIWKYVVDNGIPVNGIPAPTVADLQVIADNEPNMAGAMSRGLLNVFYGYQYEVVALDPSDGPLQLLAPPNTANGNTYLADRQYVAAYPNPARKSVSFNWQLPKGTEEGTILLSDMQGREVERIAVSGQYGSIDWQTDKADAGIYFYKIKFKDGESDMTKLVILK